MSHHFRDGCYRRRCVYFRKNLRPPLVGQRNQSKKNWEGRARSIRCRYDFALVFSILVSIPWSAWQLALTGLLIGIGGQLGGLSISVIKRDIGTKDMAATIPGHGRILDRIDSLVHAAPLFVQMAGYYYSLR